MPTFTQVAEHDVMIVADERGDFGDYFPSHLAAAPVAGTLGPGRPWLAPQRRAMGRGAAAKPLPRLCQAADAGGGLRRLGGGAQREAAARTQSGDARVVADYIRGPEFRAGGVRNRSLSYRAWNGELRQPMLIAQPRALVSLSPQGFLHPSSDLDALGFDAPEVKCKQALMPGRALGAWVFLLTHRSQLMTVFPAWPIALPCLPPLLGAGRHRVCVQ